MKPGWHSHELQTSARTCLIAKPPRKGARSPSRVLIALLLGTALLTSGCAAYRAQRAGIALLDEGKYAEGLAKLDEAARLSPEAREYRQLATRERERVLQRIATSAEDARSRGATEDARARFEELRAIDPKSDRARVGLAALERDAQARALAQTASQQLKAGDVAGAYESVRQATALSPNMSEVRAVLRQIESQPGALSTPMLGARYRKAVSLEFRQAPLRMVFDLLSQSTGLNFLFDREVKTDQPTTVVMKDTSIDEVLRFVLLANQLQRRVLNERTVLVYPNTQAKTREYQELVVRTFYLGNSDPKITLNLLRSVVKARDVFIDEKLGMLVMRDTPEAIRIAEKLIANQDLAEPEVMLELEVLEVSRSDLYELGIRYPDQVSFSIQGSGGSAGSLTLPEWQNRSSGLVRLSTNNPAFVVNFRNTFGSSNLLANPRIRVRNREKAKIHIGDKVPVITTTSTATGFVSEAVQYLDVGLKLDVEPTVHLEEEVGIRVGLEVSNILEQVRSASGTLTYRIGTRNAATVLRLKDGETQILAGLISDEDRSSANRVPGLGAVPLLGRLFGSTLDQSSKTEVVLLMTPRIVRQLARPDVRQLEFESGTEASLGSGAPGGGQPLFSPSPAQPPAPPAPSNVIQPAPGTFGPTFLLPPGAPRPGQ